MRFSWIAKLGLLGMAVWGGGRAGLVPRTWRFVFFTPIDDPDTSKTYPQTFPSGVNDSGQIVGSFVVQDHDRNTHETGGASSQPCVYSSAAAVFIVQPPAI
jgi:hypothetical protein